MSSTAPQTASTYTVEYTDTYGGESNYSWVKRLTLTHTGTDRSLVRKVKKALGLNGVRAHVHYHGDTIEIRPSGMCTVAFIFYVGDVA
jgi:hypothetical protein